MPQDRLTNEDINKLVAKVRSLSVKLPGESFPRIFAVAQDAVLPVHKRYRKTVLQQRSKWSQKLQQAFKSAGLWPGYQPPKLEAPVPVRTPRKHVVASPAPTPAPVVATTPAPVPAPQHPVDPLPGLISQILERLFKELEQRVTPQIDKQIQARIESIFSRAEESDRLIGGVVGDDTQNDVVHVIEHTAMPKSLPRVFVIGLLPEQIMVLRKKLSDAKVELRFWKNEAQTKLTENAEWADEIYIMSKFVSHSDMHAVRNKGRTKIKYCNGAVSDLERQIRFTIPQELVA